MASAASHGVYTRWERGTPQVDRASLAGSAMSRSLDAARSFLEQLEARGGREGAVLAGEFSVSGRAGRPRAALRLLALDGPDVCSPVRPAALCLSLSLSASRGVSSPRDLSVLLSPAPLSVAVSPCLSSPSASRGPEGDVHGRVGRSRASLRVPAPSPRSRNRPVAEQGGRSPALDTRRPAAPGDQAATPVVLGRKGLWKEEPRGPAAARVWTPALIGAVAWGALSGPSGLSFSLGEMRTLMTQLA